MRVKKALVAVCLSIMLLVAAVPGHALVDGDSQMDDFAAVLK